MYRNSAVLITAGFSLFAASCSNAPEPPKPGSPAFSWGAAKTTYAAGDFVKASDNLVQIVKDDNEFKARALPAAMVIETGIARAYMNLADAFEDGARANRANPMPLRRQATQFRNYASSAALECAELLHKFLAAPKTDTVPYAFPYPTGAAAEPVSLQRVAKGILLPDAEIESLQRAMIQRGVALSLARTVSGAEDTAKTLEMMKAGDVKIARDVFVLEMAKSLHAEADLFSPKKMDQPQRVAMLCQEAEEALKTLPEGKETKELQLKIAKAKKESKLT